MTLTLNLLVALLIALGLSIGLFLVGGRHEARAARALASAESALATVRDPSARRSTNAEAEGWETRLSPIFRLFSKGTGSAERALVRSTGLRITLARKLIPTGLFVLALGVIAGLVRRDRARDLVLYSSVTYSYAGKFLALAGIAYGVFAALSPFAPPLWTLYPDFAVAALGAALYVGNLPPRL